jgi:hypothetical protein
MLNNDTINKIQKFIDDDYNNFIALDDSEVCEFEAIDIDNDIVEYLRENYRYDYRDICVYYVADENAVWVENMSY